MCGRFSLTDITGLLVRFGFHQIRIEFNPRYNIAPGQPVWAVVSQENQPRLVQLSWGLIPYWAKDNSKKMINARAETLEQKPTFKHCLKSQRCLIPADGYYEWKKKGKVKKPYRFTLKSGDVFTFAGLWDSWEGPSGEKIISCAIITVEANKLVSSIHQRMPAILKPEEEHLWLDGSITGDHDLKSLLKPYPAELMNFYRASPLVNSPRNDLPECLLPVS